MDLPISIRFFRRLILDNGLSQFILSFGVATFIIERYDGGILIFAGKESRFEIFS